MTWPVGPTVTVYPVRGELPTLLGGDHDSVATLFPGAAANDTGEPGTWPPLELLDEPELLDAEPLAVPEELLDAMLLVEVEDDVAAPLDEDDVLVELLDDELVELLEDEAPEEFDELAPEDDVELAVLLDDVAPPEDEEAEPDDAEEHKHRPLAASHANAPHWELLVQAESRLQVIEVRSQ